MASLQAYFEMAIYSDLGQELVSPAPHAAKMIKAIVCSYITMSTYVADCSELKGENPVSLSTFFKCPPALFSPY